MAFAKVKSSYMGLLLLIAYKKLRKEESFRSFLQKKKLCEYVQRFVEYIVGY